MSNPDPGAYGQQLFDYRRHVNDFPLSPETTALVVVDMQYASASPDHGFMRVFKSTGHAEAMEFYERRLSETVVPNIQALLGEFRRTDATVVFLQVGSLAGDFSDFGPRMKRTVDHWRSIGIDPPYAVVGTEDFEVLREIAPLDSEQRFEKSTSSGFHSTKLDEFLRRNGVTAVVFVGVGTNHCVQSTLRDASDLGYDCVLVEDGTSGLTETSHRLGVQSAEPFCRVETTEGVISLLNASA